MENITIIPVSLLPEDVVETYWQTLYMENTLRFRLCDTIDPTFEDVKDIIRRAHGQMYMVIDITTKEAVAEFMLENFTGRSAQVHFSMHPRNNFKDSIKIGNYANDTVLNEWIHPEYNGPYLESLFGLTPVTNRAACLFIRRCGYKKIGVLPKGIKDRGKIVDAMITIREGTK